MTRPVRPGRGIGRRRHIPHLEIQNRLLGFRADEFVQRMVKDAARGQGQSVSDFLRRAVLLRVAEVDPAAAKAFAGEVSEREGGKIPSRKVGI